MATTSSLASASLNDERIAVRLGWAAVEIVGRVTTIYWKRSKKGASVVERGVNDHGNASQVTAAAAPAAADDTQIPSYRIGRGLTLAGDSRSLADLSDSLQLWFLARTVGRLCAHLNIMADDRLDALPSGVRTFLRSPDYDSWRAIFHTVEELNRQIMVELTARSPTSAKAYRCGKLLAQLFWSLPSEGEFHDRIGPGGGVDAYSLLQGLEISEMSKLIRDLRELDPYLPEGSFPVLAAGISAWEIKGRLYREGGVLRLSKRAHLPGLRHTLVNLPFLRRLVRPDRHRPAGGASQQAGPRQRSREGDRAGVRRGLLTWLDPAPQPLQNIDLSPAEAKAIRRNLRAQSDIWRDIVFEAIGPSRLLRASDWFRINFTSMALVLLVAVVVITILAGLGLALAFFAGPAVFDLARASYGDGELKATQILRSLAAGPLLTAAGAIISRLRFMADLVQQARDSVRARLISATVRQQAIRNWNEGL